MNNLWHLNIKQFKCEESPNFPKHQINLPDSQFFKIEGTI